MCQWINGATGERRNNDLYRLVLRNPLSKPIKKLLALEQSVFLWAVTVAI